MCCAGLLFGVVCWRRGGNFGKMRFSDTYFKKIMQIFNFSFFFYEDFLKRNHMRYILPNGKPICATKTWYDGVLSVHFFFCIWCYIYVLYNAPVTVPDPKLGWL